MARDGRGSEVGATAGTRGRAAQGAGLGAEAKDAAETDADAPLPPLDRGDGRTRGGAFAPGNRHWQRRALHGRKPRFASPEALCDACLAYFDWAEANPLIEVQTFRHEGRLVRVPVPRPRAFTLEGLCLFLGIGRSTWASWRDRDASDFLRIVEQVEAIILVQKIEGAAVGIFNAQIVARDLSPARRTRLRWGW